jgi:hypothetical protein
LLKFGRLFGPPTNQECEEERGEHEWASTVRGPVLQFVIEKEQSVPNEDKKNNRGPTQWNPSPLNHRTGWRSWQESSFTNSANEHFWIAGAPEYYFGWIVWTCVCNSDSTVEKGKRPIAL